MKILLLLLFFVVANLYASIGKVTALLGDVYVIRDLKSSKIEKGFTIQNKDIFLSKSKSKVEITFIDDTVISIGQKSSFLIEDYVYDKEHKENSKCSLKFSKGSFKSITGKIGKIGQDKFKLKTQNANISVLGTTVIAYQLINDQGQKVTVQVTLKGSTGISGNSGAQQLVQNGEVSIVVGNSAATVATQASAELIQALLTATNALNSLIPNLSSISIQNNSIKFNLGNTSHVISATAPTVTSLATIAATIATTLALSMGDDSSGSSHSSHSGH